MRLLALSLRLWVRALARRFRARNQKPVAPIRRRPPLTLATVEDRALPGNVLDALIGVTALGSLIDLPTNTPPGETAAQTSAFTALPAGVPAPQDPPAEAGADEPGENVDRQSSWIDGALTPVTNPDGDPLLVDLALVAPADDMAAAAAVGPGDDGGAGGAGGPFVDNPVTTSTGDPAGGQTVAGTLAGLLTPPQPGVRVPGGAATAPVAGGGAGQSVATPAPGAAVESAATTPAGPAAATVGGTVTPPSHPSLAAFGFVSHTPLQGGTTPVGSPSALTPGSRASALTGPGHGNGHRPAGLFGSVGATTGGESSFGPARHKTRGNVTGVAGSVSPAALAGGTSAAAPAGAVRQAERFGQRAAGGAAEPGTAPAALPAADPGSGSTGDPAGADAAGWGGMVMMPMLSPPPPPIGSFTFTLTQSGQDDQGAYTLTENGSGTLPGADPDVSAATVTITAQLDRGDGGSPTTDTQSFDPAGAGLLLGFDLDGYNAATFGVAPTTATAYSLDVTGSDPFADNSTTTTTTTPAADESDTETATVNDSGTDAFHQTVTGPGRPAPWSRTTPRPRSSPTPIPRPTPPPTRPRRTPSPTRTPTPGRTPRPTTPRRRSRRTER